MNYWWVNQKQTYKFEVGDGNGYMWSPKLQKNGKPHFSYENMKKLRPGDIVFSFADSLIKAVGVVQSLYFSFPRPGEFGNVGEAWMYEGWRVNVKYTLLKSPLKIKSKINEIKNFLPSKYSPIQADNGNANQAYLFQIDRDLALKVAAMIDHNILRLVQSFSIKEGEIFDRNIKSNIAEWEDVVEKNIKSDNSLSLTEREQVIKARKGQGIFRNNLLKIENHCRITKVDDLEHLIASHIKPWRSAKDSEERLDPENGFLMTPTIDHLFDRGYISFENNGKILLTDIVDTGTMEKMGVLGKDVTENIGSLTEGQKNYLEWHRENILIA